MIDGITSAVVGVTGFGPHLEFLCGELGFAVEAEGTVAAPDAARLWPGVGGDVDVKLLAAAGSPTGRIQLVRVARPPAPAEHPHVLDLGLGGLDIYTRDLAASHERLREYWWGAPAAYEIEAGGLTVAIAEGFCHAPDGTCVVLVQPGSVRSTGAWDADPARPYTEVTSVVCHVPDPDAEIAFWCGLGMELWYDVAFSSPEFERMAGLPEGTRTRLAFLAGPGGGTARIEVLSLEASREGTDRRAAQRPGRSLGHSGWSVETRDLDAAVAAAHGVREPFTVTTPLHGTARVALVDSPGGVAVELWQRV